MVDCMVAVKSVLGNTETLYTKKGTKTLQLFYDPKTVCVNHSPDNRISDWHLFRLSSLSKPHFTVVLLQFCYNSIQAQTKAAPFSAVKRNL